MRWDLENLKQVSARILAAKTTRPNNGRSFQCCADCLPGSKCTGVIPVKVLEMEWESGWGGEKRGECCEGSSAPQAGAQPLSLP